MKNTFAKRVVTLAICVALVLGVIPFTASAAIADWENTNKTFEGTTFGTNGYYNVISKKDYTLVPGAATETEMVLNNSAGTRRQVFHIIELDPSNPDVSVLPGYYGIDKFAADPTNTANQKAAGVTNVAEYYDTTLGYQVVGAMNTALAYDNNAPFSYLVYNGEVLVDAKGKVNNFHSGACQTMLCVYKDEVTGECSCELRTHSQGLRGDEWQAIGANFAMTVNNGQLVSKTEERTSESAARSMVGVKEDGTLVLVMNDGRNANNSKGLCSYELGESMLALGCKWAFNCDGGGSSSFVTRRAGEEDLVCRCVPCDGAERPTLNSVIIVSNVAPTGELKNIDITSDYDIFAPNTTYTFGATAIDTHGYAMDLPNDTVWALSDDTFGTIEAGTFVSGGKTGNVSVQVKVGGVVVGEKEITVANPTTLGFTQSSTVLPYGRTTTLSFNSYIGESKVYLDGSSFNFVLSNPAAGTLNGLVFTATDNESITDTVITATYVPTGDEYQYSITFGKGSEIIWDFEDADLHDFLGQQDAYDWQLAHGVEEPFGNSSNTSQNTLLGKGQISTDVASTAFIASEENGGKVHNGNYSLGYTFDMTQVNFNSWTYCVMFNVGNVNGDIVFRDVANGKKATKFGCWVYVPKGFRSEENSGSLALQANLFGGNTKESAAQVGLNMQYNGKNLNALTEADIPENRWVYCVADISKYNYVSLVDPLQSNHRSPSIMRMYIKPSVAQKLTYYFDNFTLDYSSAVEDRVPPVINNPQYAPADENYAFTDGVAITSPSAGFTAYVSDDNSGIDASTAKIYIDGNAVQTKINGNMMFCDAVSLGVGEHMVKFEVADNLGNYTTLTRKIVSNTDEHGMVYRTRIGLEGHNDSGTTPMPGSVYYIDVTSSYSEPLGTAEFTLFLNTANEWILDGMEAAEGYNVSYEVNPVNPNEVKFTVTSSLGNSGKKVILTIPVRTYNPLIQNGISDGSAVTVSGKLIKSPLTVQMTSCTVAGSYGNYAEYSVAELEAHKKTVRHEHTAVAIEDKEPEIGVAGYTGRTYCEVCQSIVDFGTIIPALVHTHTYELVDGHFVCSDCDDVFVPENGLFTMNDKSYYAIAGNLLSGWQKVEDDWYYFDEETKEGISGTKNFGTPTYEFENGKLESGVWVTLPKGVRYYYGPSCYTKCFVEIDGNTYYFGEDHYMYTGNRWIKEHPGTPPTWYTFSEEGVLEGTFDYSGIYRSAVGTFYLEDGISVYAGLVKDGDDYYYFPSTNYCEAATGVVTVNRNNGLLKQYGKYEFGADGRMLQGIVEKEDNIYYYVLGNLKKNAGLIEVDGYYYYIDENGIALTGEVDVVKTNNIFPAGTYNFDAEGKMIAKNGLVEEGGALYYYSNNVKQSLGLIEVDGDYYYINSQGMAVTGKYYINNTRGNGILPAGNYEFGDDAKLLNGIVEKEDGIYYYLMGVKKNVGLIEVDGDYYFIGTGGKAATEKTFVSESRSNGILPAGNYVFGSDGKLLNGVYNIDGYYYYYVMGVRTANGLTKVGDDYYYFTSKWYAATGKHYVSDKRGNGILPAGNYLFGEDGKLLNGVYYIDGHYYHYVMGVRESSGLTKVGDDYYYFTSKWYAGIGKCHISEARGHGYVGEGDYIFGEDGKMLRGFVNDGDDTYYYVMGQAKHLGLTEIDGDLYYIGANGKVVKNAEKYWVNSYNNHGLASVGNHSFGADGKMIK